MFPWESRGICNNRKIIGYIVNLNTAYKWPTILQLVHS